ncbi:class F sortase [Actinomadura rupiterrae]|uniref:class F sortase n=1 Tax=Actinomadura rupiterrae TaxID=559627 RepID=UPI0020A383FA|nr:class F sortase [Actinomadura rupiterrae]MCP2342335.1 sortase (surface protein transpeptidase) [Actinomadura rupiterrae]
MANRGYLFAGGLAVLGAVAIGHGLHLPAETAHYRDLGGPRALWSIPDGSELGAATPERIEIPDAGVRASVMPVGQNEDGTVEVPPFKVAERVGWYRGGPAPGMRGSSVLLGHYDDQDGPAVFYKLHKVKAGATVKVARSDGRTALFTVDAVEQVPKWDFPRSRVYGDVRYAGLRLITCGGSYNREQHSYRDNLIVYAHLTGSR